jgi:nitrate reductase NapE component
MAEVGSTTVSIALAEDELLGAHLLAKLEGIEPDDDAAFGDMLRFTMQRGIVERLKSADIDWPPTAEAFALAESIHPPPNPEAPAAKQEPARSRTERLQTAVLGVALVALAIGFVGGYVFKWSWTGFDSSNQVWDWLNLLLLPVAFATFPLWLRYSRYMSDARRRALGTAILVFAAFVAAGYLAPLGWSGFRGQTLWDWMTLVLLPLAILTVKAWPSTGRDVHAVHITAVGLVAVGLVVTVVGGYAANWAWTGYHGNTLWDWLQLVLAPVAVATVIVPSLTNVVSGRADLRADEEKMRTARTAALAEARARTQAARTV